MSVQSSKFLSFKNKMPTVGGSYFLVTWNFPCFLKSIMKYNKYDLNQQGYFFLSLFFFFTQYHRISWFCVHYREHIVCLCTQQYWGGQLVVLMLLVVVAYFYRKCWLPDVFQHNSMFSIYLDWLNYL